MAEQILPLPPAPPSIRLLRIKKFLGGSITAVTIKYLRWRVLRIIAQTVRDPNAKCPACGARDGEIRWAAMMKWPDNTVGALVHQCKTCHAAWGEKPIVAAKDWVISLSEQEASLFREPQKRA